MIISMKNEGKEERSMRQKIMGRRGRTRRRRRTRTRYIISSAEGEKEV